jgi:uncharacterized protein
MRDWRAPLLAWLALLAWTLAAPLHAQDLLPVPALSARVVDTTQTLPAAERDALEQRLAAFEAEAGPQIVLLMVATTAPEDITSYAQRVADTWKIGRREVGDGVLVVVARNDRRVRIEVAKALEGAIPDLAARQIVDQAMRTPFREGRYGDGLMAAVERLEARIRGEKLPAPPARGGDGGGDGNDGPGFEELAVFFFVGVAVAGQVLTAIFGRKFGALLTAGAAGGIGWWISTSLLVAGGAAIAALVLVGILGIGSAMRRLGRGGRSLPHIGGWNGGGGGTGGGGSWGGGGGGGFSSGGGGDFGGGGASGDW